MKRNEKEEKKKKDSNNNAKKKNYRDNRIKHYKEEKKPTKRLSFINIEGEEQRGVGGTRG